MQFRKADLSVRIFVIECSCEKSHGKESMTDAKCVQASKNYVHYTSQGSRMFDTRGS